MAAEYDLADLERLEKAATPGPMFQDCDLLFVQGKEINHAVAYVSSGMDDAALLRALRNAAPAMLRDLRELEARRKGEWKDLDAENAALSSLREAFAAGPEMGRAKMALFLRAERDECLESCKGLARLVRDNIHLGRDLQCANAMLEDATQGYHLMGDVLQLVIERDELREVAGRMLRQIRAMKTVGGCSPQDACDKCPPKVCNFSDIEQDARNLGLGG